MVAVLRTAILSSTSSNVNSLDKDLTFTIVAESSPIAQPLPLAKNPSLL